MNTKETVNEYRKLASTLDYVDCPKHNYNQKIPSVVKWGLPLIGAAVFLIVPPFQYSDIPHPGLLGSSFIFTIGYLISLFTLCVMTSDIPKTNYLKMKQISKKMKKTFLNIELEDCFDVNCSVTRDILKKRKHEILASYSNNHAIKATLIFSLIEEIEKEKQILQKLEIFNLGKTKEVIAIQEECSILQYANTINSKNISLINNI